MARPGRGISMVGLTDAYLAKLSTLTASIMLRFNTSSTAIYDSPLSFRSLKDTCPLHSMPSSGIGHASTSKPHTDTGTNAGQPYRVFQSVSRSEPIRQGEGGEGQHGD